MTVAISIHCHLCGGFISDPLRVSHRLPPDAGVIAVPRSGFCSCREPVVFDPSPAGRVSGLDL